MSISCSGCVVALKGSGVANEQIVQIVCESDVSVGSSLVDTLARGYWVKMLALFSRMLDITSLKKQQELEPFLGHSRT